MALKIKGTVVHHYHRQQGDEEQIELVIKDHNGVFKTSGIVKVSFDDQAVRDLFSHIKKSENEDAIKRSIDTLDGKKIKIIIK